MEGEEFTLQLAYTAQRDSYVLIVDSIPRCEVQREHWASFIKWLREGWTKEGWGCFEVLHLPRSKDVVLMVFGPMGQAVVVLWIQPQQWAMMVDALEDGAAHVDTKTPREMLRVLPMSAIASPGRLEKARLN